MSLDVTEARPALVAPVLAVDPGGTSGMAWRMPDGSYMTAVAMLAEDVWEAIDPDLVTHVIYEQFAGRFISSHGQHTIRIIGGIQALCNRFDIPREGRPPQTRIPFLKKARDYIKATKGSSHVVHEVDALAHLMCWEAVGSIARKERQKSKKYTRSKA